MTSRGWMNWVKIPPRMANRPMEELQHVKIHTEVWNRKFYELNSSIVWCVKLNRSNLAISMSSSLAFFCQSNFSNRIYQPSIFSQKAINPQSNNTCYPDLPLREFNKNCLSCNISCCRMVFEWIAKKSGYRSQILKAIRYKGWRAIFWRFVYDGYTLFNLWLYEDPNKKERPSLKNAFTLIVTLQKLLNKFEREIILVSTFLLTIKTIE